MKTFILILSLSFILSCNINTEKVNQNILTNTTAVTAKHNLQDSLGQPDINASSTTPGEVVQFAERQIGVPYVYASIAHM